jgi:RNA polymerase-binding protein DksA
MSEHDEIRHQLLDMLEELDERLGKITDDVKHVDHPPEQDFSEQATEAENNEVLDALGNATRDEIEKIKQALFRMDKGTYGFCVSCGEAIKKERLHAIPFASLCIQCASKAEKHLH